MQCKERLEMARQGMKKHNRVNHLWKVKAKQINERQGNARSRSRTRSRYGKARQCKE
jgi:hypothetical protein